jgi:hypothetical protein
VGSDASPEEAPGSLLRFNEFVGEKLKTYQDLKPSLLKEKIVAHFLPYLDRMKSAGKDFTISINLEVLGSGAQKDLHPDSQTITPSDIPPFTEKPIHDDSLSFFDDISMRYIVEDNSAHRLHLTAVSVDGRTLPINLVEDEALPVNCSAIFLFESPMFTGTSDTARQRLVLPEGVSESDLFRVLRREVSAILNENFEEIEQRNIESKQYFEKQYPFLTGYFEEDTIGIVDRDQSLWAAQKRFFHDQKQILECATLDKAAFEKSLELSSRSLTMYVLYREFIIQKLREISEEDVEYTIHNLIVPRFEEYHSDKFLDSIYRNNAWVLDDKFMSFRTVLSEYSMEKLIKEISTTEEISDADGRPDISMVFSADPKSNEKVEVVVIELKRQTDDLKENGNVQFQLIDRARKLADHCPNIGRVWYFGIIQINANLARILKDAKWAPLFSKDQVFYQDFPVTRSDGIVVPSPMYLLSYEAIIQDATDRNHTFLQILRHDIKKAQARKNGHFN